MLEANALFAQHPKLTRLITTLSPEDMTEDPVFSFNPALPDVIPVHAGKIVMNCGDSDVETAQGFKIQNVSSSLQGLQDLPAALRIETLSEEGQAIVVTDNTDAITTELRPAVTANMNTNPKTGCSTVDPMTLGFGAALILMRMRSKRRAARS